MPGVLGVLLLAIAGCFATGRETTDNGRLIFIIMYLLAIVFPLIGGIVAGLLGRFVGSRGALVLTVVPMICSTLLSILILIEVGLYGCPVHIDLSPWFSIGSIIVRWGFYFDSLTACMMVTVCLVSTAVHIYSVGYMSGYPHIPRFISYLSLFTFGMLVLVTADNLFQMFLGWEGNSLCPNGCQTSISVYAYIW